MKVIFRHLVLLFVVGSLSSSVTAALRYNVTYRGVLSALQTLDIADATLTDKVISNAGLRRSELQVSSAGHGIVESLYPFRYRVRSLYRENGVGAVAFELFKQTRRIKQEVFYVDSASRKLTAYGKMGDGPELPESIATQLGVGKQHRQSGDGMHVAEEQLFDRLSLLHYLGSLPLAVGSDYTLAVTNGDETFEYRVRVSSKERLAAAGRVWDTWRLRLDATDDQGEPAHKPVDLWLADEPGRMLIRAEAKHPIGRFSISLLESDSGVMNGEGMRRATAP